MQNMAPRSSFAAQLHVGVSMTLFRGNREFRLRALMYVSDTGHFCYVFGHSRPLW